MNAPERARATTETGTLPGPTGRFGARSLATLAAVAAVYFAAAKFGLSLAFATHQVTAVWPPTGIAFVAYLVLGYRVWPAVFVGAFVANATANEPLATAAGIAVGNTLQGLAGVFLIRRTTAFEGSLQRTQDLGALVVCAAALGCGVSATSGVLNLVLAGIVPWSAYTSVWWVWWVGDAMGVLLIAPVLLTWIARPRLAGSAARRVELGFLFLALGVACVIALSGAILRSDTLFRLEYAIFPFLIWCALRFGQRETATAVLMTASVAIWGTIHDKGPFATGTLDQRLVLLDAFIAVVSVTSLTLGAVVAERRRAEQSLKEANDDLERRVDQRTLELATANRDLSKKNEEVEAFVYIVSHDLRAPLVNLQGFSKELERSCQKLGVALGAVTLPAPVDKSVRFALEEDIPSALRFISASSSKFQRLIDALLTLSRSGRHEYRSEAVDVAAVVSTTIDSLRESIDKSGATVSVKDLPQASGDTTAIGQVFSNLIANALNYLDPARPGRIEIGGESQGDLVDYWIRDNGSGIPESAKKRLFQVFQRFHPRLAAGDGMGLAIVRRIVERHGGRITAESEEAVGTTFRVTLPAVHPVKEREPGDVPRA